MDSLGNRYLWKVFRVTNDKNTVMLPKKGGGWEEKEDTRPNRPVGPASFSGLDRRLEKTLNQLEEAGWDVYAIMPTDGGGGINVVARKFYVDEQRDSEVFASNFGEDE